MVSFNGDLHRNQKRSRILKTAKALYDPSGVYKFLIDPNIRFNKLFTLVRLGLIQITKTT